MFARWTSVNTLARPLGRLLMGATFALGLAVSSQPGEAALIELDSGFGTSSITRDTATGLEWLDLSYTSGMKDEVDARLASGDLFGWRRATMDEVVAFWANAGITATGSGEDWNLSDDPALMAAVIALMDNLGIWDSHPSVQLTGGLTAEAGEGQNTWYAAFLSRYRFSEDDPFSEVAATTWALRAVATPSGLPCCEEFHSWLVRDYVAETEVPEPAPFALLALGAGLVGLGARRRRA